MYCYTINLIKMYINVCVVVMVIKFATMCLCTIEAHFGARGKQSMSLEDTEPLCDNAQKSNKKRIILSSLSIIVFGMIMIMIPVNNWNNKRMLEARKKAEEGLAKAIAVPAGSIKKIAKQATTVASYSDDDD